MNFWKKLGKYGKKYNIIKYNKRSRRSKRQFRTYSFAIVTDYIDYSSTQFDSQNLKFDLLNLLTTNDVFIKLMEMYQQYKITSINFKAIPRTVNGTQPKPCIIFLDTQNSLQFNYTGLERLQGAKHLSGKRTQTINFKTTGRQDDFSYWFDPLDGPNCSIRLRSLAEPSTSVFWQFQLKFYIKVRGMRLVIQNDNQNEKIVKNKQQVDLVENDPKIPLEVEKIKQKCREIKQSKKKNEEYYESEIESMKETIKILKQEIKQLKGSLDEDSYYTIYKNTPTDLKENVVLPVEQEIKKYNKNYYKKEEIPDEEELKMKSQNLINNFFKNNMEEINEHNKSIKNNNNIIDTNEIINTVGTKKKKKKKHKNKNNYQ
jgi:hypothetical protein